MPTEIPGVYSGLPERTRVAPGVCSHVRGEIRDSLDGDRPTLPITTEVFPVSTGEWLEKGVGHLQTHSGHLPERRTVERLLLPTHPTLPLEHAGGG